MRREMLKDGESVLASEADTRIVTSVFLNRN